MLQREEGNHDFNSDFIFHNGAVLPQGAQHRANEEPTSHNAKEPEDLQADIRLLRPAQKPR